MRRGWAVAAATTAMLVLAGCGSGSGSSGAGWSAPDWRGAAAPELTDPAAIDAALDDALAGGDSVECVYRAQAFPGTFIVGPGENVWMEMDSGAGVMVRDSAFSVWLPENNIGMRFSPAFSAEVGLEEMSASDFTGEDGEVGPCRVLGADVPQPPTGIDFTDVDGQGDMVMWLADSYNDPNASSMVGLMFGDWMSEQGQAMFYLGLGMLMSLSDAEVQRYGALSESAQLRYWEDLTAGMTVRQYEAFIDEALDRLRPEHRRVVERVLND